MVTFFREQKKLGYVSDKRFVLGNAQSTEHGFNSYNLFKSNNLGGILRRHSMLDRTAKPRFVTIQGILLSTVQGRA
jgi:hypothetical protein